MGESSLVVGGQADRNRIATLARRLDDPFEVRIVVSVELRLDDEPAPGASGFSGVFQRDRGLCDGCRARCIPVDSVPERTRADVAALCQCGGRIIT